MSHMVVGSVISSRSHIGTIGAGNPAGPNCVLLLHCDGTSGSTSFPDSSGQAHVVTAYGSANVNTAVTKFGTGSAHSTTANDYLGLDGSANFSFGAGNFTIDFWLQTADVTGSVIGTYATGTYTAGQWAILLSSSVIYWRHDASIDITSGSTLFPTTGWHHLAFVRASGTTTIYLDGVSVASGADTGNYTNVAGAPVIFSDAVSTPAIGGIYPAYIDEVRILNGYAAWTGNFTPPTAPYANPPPPVLLLHFDGTAGSTSFPDSSGKNHVATAHGAAALETTTAKFGTAALSLTGAAGTWVALDGSTDFDFGTGDFTIDMWIYQTANTGDGTIFNILPTSSATANSFQLFSSSLTDVVLMGGLSAVPYIVGTITASTWEHIAVTRASGTTRLFVNGVLAGSGADANNYIVSSVSALLPSIGALNPIGGGGALFNGYIDELRVINGYAAWTANFTPPTAPYS